MEGDPPGARRPPPDDEAGNYVVSIRNVTAQPTESTGQFRVLITTSRGEVTAYLHPCEGRTGVAIFIGGAGGGVEGPADNVYRRLADDLVSKGITSLRLEYREAGEFAECVLDTLTACSFLKGIGASEAVLVGHSFGGAVAIKGGELAPLVKAVVAMSSQRFGTQDVERLGKPLFLIHGADDQVLLPAASEDIFGRAQEPKRMVILPGAGHGLSEVAHDIYGMLDDYITRAIGDRPEG